MSDTLRADRADGVNQGDRYTQSPPGSSAIGITYVPAAENSTLRGVLNQAESQVILRALEYTGWNRKRAAILLKISYRGLLYKIRRHSITPPGITPPLAGN
jgi:DNA-binding NtrC family response regulator